MQPNLFASSKPVRVRGMALTALALAAAALALTSFPPTVIDAATPARKAAIAGPTADVVVLKSDRPHVGYLIAPLLSRMAESRGEPPLLLVRDSEVDQRTLLSLRQVSATNILHLGEAADYPPGIPVRRALADLTAGGTFQQAVAVAAYGWRQPREAVLAFAGDDANLAHAAVLATHLGVPLLPYDQRVTSAIALSAFTRLGIERLVLVTPQPRLRPSWFARIHNLTETISPTEAERRVVALLGADSIRNVAVIGPRVVDTPSARELVAYYSLVRRSALAVADSADATDVEAAVRGLIERHRLRPRSLTLFGTTDELRGHTIEFPGTLPEDLDAGGYSFDAEPGTVPATGRAIAFAVGRLPFPSVERTSQLLARTFYRGRRLAEFSQSTVMIANPNRGSALPLAETIARVTGQEFKNTRVPVREFYRTPADDAEVRAVAQAANVIIYQGHSSDQHVLESPAMMDVPEDLPDPVELSSPTMFRREFYTVDEVGEPVAPRLSLDGLPPDPPIFDESLPLQELNGLPFVLLQSCSSMSDYYTDPYFDAGAVAVVGSVTPIHSGSGSGFAKAFCNALLYQTNNVGEALRFAKNYFLCLQQLKGARRHQHLHPGWRVGHSFRLYGDPELALYSADLLKRKKRPVRATWAEEGIRVHVPEKRFKRLKTSKYTATLLPGNMAAGIVQSVEGSERRELLPFQFFTLPYTNGVPGDFSAPLRRVGDKTSRTAHLTDEFGRLYVLHFPRNEPEGKYFKLTFPASDR